MLTNLKKNRIKFFAFLAVVAVIIILVQTFQISNFLSPSLLRDKVLSYGSAAPIIFILIYSISTIFFLPGTPATIASGLIFGKFLGTFYTVIGATIGATIAFLIARFLGGDFIGNILKDKYKKLHEYNKKIEENGLLVVLFFRIVPLFPFNGLNFALGLTKIRFRDYLLGTAIGIIPGSFVLAYFGDSVANLNPVQIGISVALFALMAFIPIIYKRFKKEHRSIDKN